MNTIEERAHKLEELSNLLTAKGDRLFADDPLHVAVDRDYRRVVAAHDDPVRLMETYSDCDIGIIVSAEQMQHMIQVIEYQENVVAHYEDVAIHYDASAQIMIESINRILSLVDNAEIDAVIMAMVESLEESGVINVSGFTIPVEAGATAGAGAGDTGIGGDRAEEADTGGDGEDFHTGTEVDPESIRDSDHTLG